MSPVTGGSARVGSWLAAWTIWLSSLVIALPPERVGMRRRHRPSAMRVPVIQLAVGSKPTIVTAPVP
jgi:hypothetical protein